MAAPDLSQRFCPACGNWTAQVLCPADGALTVQLKKFAAGTEIRPGDVVGERYKIVKPLGEGGYSSVFTASHMVTGQDVAIKVLKAAYPGPDEQAVRRFYREARVTAGLSHPNTVRVFDVGQTAAGAFWLAMELLNGVSLEQKLQELANGKPPDRVGPGEVYTQQECINFVIPALRSLHEAHGQLLVHRDLKPANIVLAHVAGETVVKVLDFGIAQTRGSTLTTTGMALGTPAYMSPEQCQGLELDGRSDLYSMGIVLWRCVTGDVPFADSNPVKLMQAHLSRPLPDIWRKARTPLTQPFVDVVLKALRKDKDARYPDAAAMREAMEGASGEMSRTAMDMQAFRLDGKAPPPRGNLKAKPTPPPSPAPQQEVAERPRGDLQRVATPAKVLLDITVPTPPRRPESQPVDTVEPDLIRRATLASAPLRAAHVADEITDRHKVLHITPVREAGSVPQKPKRVWRKTIPMRGGNVVSGLVPPLDSGDTEPM